MLKNAEKYGEKMKRYYNYSSFLEKTFLQKVYKLPINIPVTCPNRDGKISTGGCIFCGEIGAGFEMKSHLLSVKEQINENKAYIKQKYKANKFIAYFQNYTNTYLPFKDFKKYIEDCSDSDIVAISISTRPDCILDEQLEFLKEFSIKNNLKIIIELGLQTTNENTLKIINRGHTVNDFINAVIKIKKYDFLIGTHIILNLPWDSNEDTIKTAKLLNELNIDIVKIHSLYILKNTVLEKMYNNKEFSLITQEEYLERCILFIEHLKSTIVIERFFGRAPKELTVFENWGHSWRYLMNELEKMLEERNIIQGQQTQIINLPFVPY